MEPEEMDWWDVVAALLDEIDYWDTDYSEEITPHQASEHLLEVLRDADRCNARLRARAEAAEAERDESMRRRDAWKAKAEGHDAMAAALRAKAEALGPTNFSRIFSRGAYEAEKAGRIAAEAEVARLRRALSRLVSAQDCGAPETDPIHPDIWRQARAALSGGDDG